MIVCECGKKIEYFIAIAHRPRTSTNRSDRHVIISGGSHFACGSCGEKIIRCWQDHNKGRTKPYEIRSAKINVTADTKKEFFRRSLPQIIGQFDWYVPKSDIESALGRTIKA